MPPPWEMPNLDETARNADSHCAKTRHGNAHGELKTRERNAMTISKSGRAFAAVAAISLAFAAAPASASDAEERFEIMELMDRYGVVHDYGSPEEYADLFTEDGEIGTPGKPAMIKGRAALIGQAVRDHEEYSAPTGPNGELESIMRHIISNRIVTLTGAESAEGSCYVITLVRDGENGPAVMSFSRYVDRYRKQGGEWKIERRDIVRGFGNAEIAKRLGFR